MTVGTGAGVEGLVRAVAPALAAATAAAAALRAAASRVDGEAAAVRAEVGRLRAADAGGWRSRAALAYRARLGDLVARASRDAGALDDLAAALRGHAAGVEGRAEALRAAAAGAAELVVRAVEEGDDLAPRLLARAEAVLADASRSAPSWTAARW
ncbi:hypothetical protein [uncultured Pseudokineococcus sp.]|uniref:hypothetical protein n=1 Tax=uncultured Pseudokineococcus sp. TaxID=1642928 RepID=UPI0026081F72|nr:hypothetical protein [uncultured Pseudokineococcus sp.]